MRVCSNIHLSAEVEAQLEILTRVVDILGIDDLSFSSYSAALMRLSDEVLSLKRASLQLKRAETELQAHRDSCRHEEKLINKWQTSIEQEHARGSTAEMQRKKEALVRKAKEYKKELDALMVDHRHLPCLSDVLILPQIQVEEPPVTISQLAAQQERIKKREADIKAKRTKIRAFQGLPPNLHLARMQLKGARDEQMELIKLRERILGKMADGIA
ncbi:hypothetical protein FIBSPDRAFT_908043 [Athelia psychrophila]|uniref:Uncharacterized protein n=1 Tax=Athelia psychrophila TaxID=1759441 RepID=A0A166T799_9AGAM|nr:hypothetical protein FIBSPDRAFT_908043 [Fibularhizoctonia sp. CBS 109695]